MRLLAAVHYLVLAGETSWEEPLAPHREFLHAFVREQRVQTNEVQRSWVLTPLFLRVAERTGADVFDLVELGPSAGLNLVWDHYRHVYAAGEWGPPDARLVLTGEERGGAVRRDLLELRPRVRTRVGIDHAPIDVTTEEGARLLKCFVWADQTERLDRLDRAIDAVRSDPPRLVPADFVDVLPDVLAAQPVDGLTVVFQTAVFSYIGADERARVREILDDAGCERPLAFVTTGRPRSEETCWGLRLMYWPGGDREFAGHADYHGAWLELEL